MKYRGNMDAECIPICDALNSITGIKTIGSCCGHNTEEFQIFFYARNFKSLAFIADLVFLSQKSKR